MEQEQQLTQQLFRVMMGSIDGPKAKELLEGQPPNTFLVRLSRSSPGDYAISYIAYDGSFQQVLINNVENRFWLEGIGYEDVASILEKEKEVLQIPYAEAYHATANPAHLTNRHKFQLFGAHRSVPTTSDIVTQDDREQAGKANQDRRSLYAPNLSTK